MFFDFSKNVPQIFKISTIIRQLILCSNLFPLYDK